MNKLVLAPSQLQILKKDSPHFLNGETETGNVTDSLCFNESVCGNRWDRFALLKQADCFKLKLNVPFILTCNEASGLLVLIQGNDTPTEHQKNNRCKVNCEAETKWNECDSQSVTD